MGPHAEYDMSVTERPVNIVRHGAAYLRATGDEHSGPILGNEMVNQTRRDWTQ